MDKADVKIKQTASQTWCLIRLLPFMIGKKVSVGNLHWEVFLMLRDIVEEIFRPVSNMSLTYVLDDMVSSHHQLYLEVSIEHLLWETVQWRTRKHFREDEQAIKSCSCWS